MLMHKIISGGVNRNFTFIGKQTYNRTRQAGEVFSAAPLTCPNISLTEKYIHAYTFVT